MKRAFDLIAAALGLLFLAPLFALIALLVKSGSRGPVFFNQERIGKGFVPFPIHKFRTMMNGAQQMGSPITFGEDPRITRVGRLLRTTKLDELPQLFNVLKGEMSLVGPRPEIRRYVELYHDDYAMILQVRPGMTDLASLKYSNEAHILGQAEHPEEEYVRRILPEKIALAKEYIKHSSLFFDAGLIAKTILKLISRNREPAAETRTHAERAKC